MKPTSDTLERTVKIVAEALGRALDEITPEATLEDLKADSLDAIEIIMMAEEEFGIELDERQLRANATVLDLARLIEKARP